jgi:raffinose/stachyose/melibiose transport system permease protein
VPSHFVAFDNFRQVLANKVFGRSLVNTGLIILVSLVIELPLALAMAVLLASGRQVGAVAFRTIFFLPYILADVAAGLIWRYMFDGDYGPISQISSELGFGPFYLLASTNFAFIAVLVTIVWKYFGFHMMLYIGGMQGIDRSLYEAAEIDGASAWQRFRFVTLPGLGPMIRLSVFFSILGSLQVFDVVRALTFDGGPLNTTHTLVSFLYIFGITRMRAGYGSAIGVIIFVLCVVVAFGYKRIFMRND